MKYLFVLFLFAVISLNAKSQTASDSVKAVVNELFTAMKTSDSVLLVGCFADSAVLQTIGRNKEKLLVKNESVKEFASSVAKAPKGSLDERIVFDMVKIDGVLASVWTPYSFYYKGNFSHCGVNSFQLIKTDKGWKIQYLIDTRRKSGCN